MADSAELVRLMRHAADRIRQEDDNDLQETFPGSGIYE